jgi:hypothetical protein
MATADTNYTRAAHTAAVRPAHHLRAVCFTCEKTIAPGEGVIHVSRLEVHKVLEAQAAARERQEAKAAAEGRSRGWKVLDIGELLALPSKARWQVHCDGCNPHRDDGCVNCYWLGVHRCSTWAQLVDWTAHFSTKNWVFPATDWNQFIRDAAQGNGKVGLICHPDDRYHDTPEL